MFRPLRLFGKNATKITTITISRTKIIYSESFLDKAERLKLWNQENKQLYGSLAESKTKTRQPSHKEKRRRVLKTKIDMAASRTLLNSSLKQFGKTRNVVAGNIQFDKGFVKDDEVICIEKEILPEKKSVLPLTNLTKEFTKLTTSNMLAVCNKLGKHRIEIITPNIKNGILASPHSNTVPSIIIRNLKMFPMMSHQKTSTAMADKSDEVVEEKILRVVSDNTEHIKFPSVTRILDQTMSPESREALEKWKQGKILELGQEGFEIFHKAQINSGSKFHGLISDHILANAISIPTDKAVEGAWASVSHVLQKIHTPRAVESMVVHPVLKYKGVIDCIAMYQDKPTLIEWKKSDRPKHALSATYDNPIQLAAYFGAISHDAHYKGLNVRDALLVIAYTDGTPADVFQLNTDHMRQHWATWLSRLERYWTATDSKNTEAANEPDKAKIVNE